MSESNHQAALMRWARMQVPTNPALRWLFAIPNGGARAKATAWRLKQEGVQPGVADLFLSVPRAGKHGLYIELKNDRPRGVLSEAQRDFLAGAQEQGYGAVVCYGWDEARRAIEVYLATRESPSRVTT